MMPKKKQMLSKGTMAVLMREVLDRNAMDVESMRIGDDAAEELGRILYEQAREIILKAAKLAIHAKRKTIKLSDISLASR